jgi:hypothetical protein
MFANAESNVYRGCRHVYVLTTWIIRVYLQYCNHNSLQFISQSTNGGECEVLGEGVLELWWQRHNHYN